MAYNKFIFAFLGVFLFASSLKAEQSTEQIRQTRKIAKEGLRNAKEKARKAKEEARLAKEQAALEYKMNQARKWLKELPEAQQLQVVRECLPPHRFPQGLGRDARYGNYSPGYQGDGESFPVYGEYYFHYNDYSTGYNYGSYSRGHWYGNYSTGYGYGNYSRGYGYGNYSRGYRYPNVSPNYGNYSPSYRKYDVERE